MLMMIEFGKKPRPRTGILNLLETRLLDEALVGRHQATVCLVPMKDVAKLEEALRFYREGIVRAPAHSTLNCRNRCVEFWDFHSSEEAAE